MPGEHILALAKSVDEAQGPSDRPSIKIIAGELPNTVDQAEDALLSANVDLYQRGSMIVRPTQVAILAAGHRETTGQRLVAVRKNHLTECMTASADWLRYDKRSEEWLRVNCPAQVAETYLEREGMWRLRVLAGLTNAPILRPDGSILDAPGYDRATGILYDPGEAKFPAIPVNPSKDDAVYALGLLKELIATFPFAASGNDDPGPSRSVALSALLTAIIRRSILTAPLHAFTAPTAGTGKSTLVDMANMIAAGRLAAVIAQGKSEEEMEKRLGAALIAGDAVVSIDNVEQPIGGELLCQALTQPMLKIRVLGLSKNIEVLSNAAIYATGNNLTVVGDMSRRALLCSLDANCERPELRQFDRHPLDAIRQDRGKYVIAALTVLRAYHIAGRPCAAIPLGSFEEWSSWVRGALLWLDEADPCDTMETIRKNDPKLEALTTVIEQWDAVIGSDRVSVKDLIERATRMRSGTSDRPEFVHGDLREALLVVAGDGGAINSRRLGKWLGKNKGGIVDGKKIEESGGYGGVTFWALRK